MRRTRSSSQASSSQSSQEDSAPQVECVPSKKRSKKPATAKPTQWVTILPENMVSSETSLTADASPTFVSLRGPKTGALQQYLVSHSCKQICEVQRCSDEPRSWFIDDTVQTDGSLLLCTPVDPLFMVLPYLTKAGKAGKFTTLEAILDDPTSNSTELEGFVQQDQWKHVCDMKVLSSGMRVYRYSQPRTLQWLRKKVDALAAELKTQGVQVGPGSHSAVLIKSKKQTTVTQEDYLQYACSLVSEYLEEELASSLSQSYNFKAFKRVSEDASEQPPAKKQRSESVDSGMFSQQSSMEESQTGNEPLEDYTKYNSILPSSEPTKLKKQTSAQKALSKVDKTGMKSLSSFFGKSKT